MSAVAPTKFAFRDPGIYALKPDAFGIELLIAAPMPADPFYLIAGGAAACIEIDGPLSYSLPICQTYAGVLTRVRAALKAAPLLVLKINSPGGEVFGAFDTAAAIRREARAAGVRVIAHTSAQACSAGYALAAAADEILLSSAATAGSIGVIAMMCEQSRADAALGQRYLAITSGARKADGNPHVPATDAAIAALQAGVDATARVFFDWCKAARGLDAEPLQAAVFVGAEAVKAGVADRVVSWDELMVELASPPAAALAGATEFNANRDSSMPNDPSDKKDSDARKALAAAAESGDEKAKRALAAYDDEPKKGAESDEPEKKDDKKDAKSASSKADFGKDDDKDKDKDAKAAAAATAQLASLAAEVQRLSGELAARAATDAATARASFRASRPDVPDSVFDALKDAPLAQVQAVVSAIPKGNPAIIQRAEVLPRGSDLNNPLSVEAIPLSMRMAAGLVTPDFSAVQNRGVEQVFGVAKQ